jgi:2-keto-myo-inositol isomerase
MIEQGRFSLNRIVYPRLDIAGFFELASRLGIRKVELRNDIPGGILDGQSPEQVRTLAKKNSVKIITINALQNFNNASQLPELLGELTELLKVAVSVECEAVILCPSNSKSDRRSREQILEETVGALKTFRPYFEESGLFGYLEPLGFMNCSLRSLADAMNAIRESRGKNYKIVYDTFHHFIGPDTAATIEKGYDVSYTGLVHVSGVTSQVSPDQYTDDVRVMLGPEDRIGNIKQIALLDKLGYRGNISFEPFSKEVHELDIRGIEETIRQSVKFIQNMADRPASVSRASSPGTT